MATTKSRTSVDVDDEVGRMAAIYLEVFSSPGGRLVLEDLQKSFADRRSFVEGDPHATSFREGQRDVLLAIMDLMRRARDPETYGVRVEDE